MRAIFLVFLLWASTARAELLLQRDASPSSECTAIKDLVMVHGFNGSAGTWERWVALLQDETSLSCVRIYTFSYETGFQETLPDIQSIAKELRAALTQINAGSLFLMAHSMGGLVVKEMLLQDSDAPSVLPHLKQVFFFATPHHGIRRPIPLFAGRKSSQVKGLRRPNVRAMRHQWEEKATVQEDGLVELTSASGVYSFYGTAFVASRDGVVPHYSASGGFSDVLRISADHVSIKEPASAQDKTYQKVKTALQKEETKKPETN